jgi:glycosyltransferase involved in cell wall biosynthesis
MIAYNHEPFIEQAIEGVLKQQTSFRFELVIGDDCSKDNTGSICKHYAAQYPDIIRLLPSDKNIGMSQNFYRTLVACQSPFVAICEGDDFWTDPLKLQKQFDFMTAHPDFMLCYHKVKVLYTGGELEDDFLEKNSAREVTNVYDLVAVGNYMHTCSVMYRNLPGKFPTSDYAAVINDYFLWVWLAQFGNIKKLPDEMAIYRYGVGVFASQNNKKQMLFSQATRKNLAAALTNPTLVRILELRADNFQYYALPASVRSMSDPAELYAPEVLADRVDYKGLLRAIGQKMKRRFK